jgi:hypothetical protein
MAIVALGLGVLAGCGALFNGGPQMVQFASQPTGAAVWVDGTPRGQTPIALGLSKSENHVVVFKLDGYNDFGATLNKHVSGGLVVLDVLGGIVPVVIDAATGSWYKLSANTLLGPITKTSTELGKADGQLTPTQLKRVLNHEPMDRVLEK